MANIKSYHLPPTSLIPNSPYPLLHYPDFLSHPGQNKDSPAVEAHDLFTSNGWVTQWIYRYGPTQTAHYHSSAHEVMAVLSGTATIRFGVADVDNSPDGRELGGVEVEAKAGDVFIVPAGVSHKTFNPQPDSSFGLLTPGDGHHLSTEGKAIAASDALANVELSGFTMIGAYPEGSEWDFCSGGEHSHDQDKVWSVPKPENDPVLGRKEEGLIGLWS